MRRSFFASSAPAAPAAATATALRALVDRADFERLVLAGDEDFLAFFVAPWSRPGRRLAEHFAKRAARHAMLGVTIDADAWPDIARRYDVTAIPSILHFRRGQVTARRIGEMSADDLDDWLADIAPAAPQHERRRV
jgi:thioredoxin-like negative regulator of GroEL